MKTFPEFIPLAEAVAEARAAGDICNDDYSPPGEPVTLCTTPRFKLEPFAEIEWTGAGEWLLQGLLPLQGLAVVYGASGSYKSFIAADLALRIARGLEWAGRAVKQGAAVYIAAEGAAGFRKRVEAFRRDKNVTCELPFYLISAAPNLGGEANDREDLITSIEAERIAAPLRLIVIDTLAQTLHGAEENGRGMMALISNANALATRFACLVLIVHHSGKDDERGARGHSSLTGAVDALWLVKKGETGLSSNVTIEKNKDDAGGLTFCAGLSRFVIHRDEATGEEVSSLVVEDVSQIDALTTSKASADRKPPANQRLLMACVHAAIDAHGRDLKPFPTGPIVRAVQEDRVRDIFYDRMADKDQTTKRGAFWRGVNNCVQREILITREINGEKFLWLP